MYSSSQSFDGVATTQGFDKVATMLQPSSLFQQSRKVQSWNLCVIVLPAVQEAPQELDIPRGQPSSEEELFVGQSMV